MQQSDSTGRSHTEDTRAARTRKPIEEDGFDKVYPRYEFSELVRLFLALVTWIQKLRRSRIEGTLAARGSGKGPTAGPTAKA